MRNKKMLKSMINERLSEAAEEIFALFEQAVAEYQREIDRLKPVSAAEQMEVPSPTWCSDFAQQTEVVGRVEPIDGVNTEYFHPKTETERVMITKEDEPQIPIPNAETTNFGDELKPSVRQERTETDSSCETPSDTEDEDSDYREHPVPVAEKPFSCAVCSKRFSQARGVRMHMTRVHAIQELLTSEQSTNQPDTEHPSPSQPADMDPKDRPFSCPICQERFPLLKRVKVHLRSHKFKEQITAKRAKANSSQTGPFSCAVCGKCFSQKFHLSDHKREHNKEKPFECVKCSEVFAHEAGFIQHMKIMHFIAKPFRCSVCGICFKNSRAFRTHMAMHNGESSRLCSAGGRSVTQSSNHKYHELTHSGEKPFSCLQ